MVGRYAKVASYFPHFGEERPITGTRGSGTIFLSYCNLRCIFCQNYQISQCGEVYEFSEEEMAWIMIELQARGCHNINFVTPTHVVPQLVKALKIAADKGLRIHIRHSSIFQLTTTSKFFGTRLAIVINITMLEMMLTKQK